MTQKHRIRVGFVQPHMEAGGVERVVLNLLRHLDRSRFEPVLILANRRGSLLGRMPADVPIHVLGGRRMLSSVPRLRRCLRRIGAEVAHGGTNVVNLALIAATMAMRGGPAVIVSEHTPARFYRDEAKWPWPRLTAMRHLYPRAWGVATPLKEIGRELLDVLNRDLRFHVLDNPVVETVPAAVGAPKPSVFEDGKVTFVGAGRLVQLKGFDIMIEAMARMTGPLGSSRLAILGDGPEREYLIELAAARGLGERVRFVGEVDNPLDYFRHADAVVMASRYDAAPNVLVEAMASEAPIIAADCPLGPRSILKDGKAGLLVPPGNPQALAVAMTRIVDDPALREGLRAEGLERARDFSVARALPGYERLFTAAAAWRDTT